jgi:inorganic pyrophosphatase
MRLDAIAVGVNPPDDVNVVIEVPIGGEPIKYEMDKAAGTLVVDRFLHTPMRYPGNYGFVPHTLSQDGDPIDVLEPGKWVKLIGWGDAEEAKQLIRDAIRRERDHADLPS